jgi:hypothetical protein
VISRVDATLSEARQQVCKNWMDSPPVSQLEMLIFFRSSSSLAKGQRPLFGGTRGMGGSAAVATASEVLDDLDPTGLAKTRTRGLSGLHQWKRSYKWLANPSTARHEFSEDTDFLMTWPVTTDF